MKKGINLQAKVHAGSGAAVSNLSQALPAAFAQANPGLQLTVKSASPVDAQGHATIHVYIEGEQEPAADFAALTRAALNKAIAALNAGAGSSGAPAAPGAAAAHTPVHLHDVQEVEGDEEDSGLVLPPAQQPSPSPAASPAPAPPAATSPSPQSSAAATASRSPWWAVWRRGKQ
jgi:hypothetical protein